MPNSFQSIKILSVWFFFCFFLPNKPLGYSEITSTQKMEVNRSPKQAAALLTFHEPNNEQKVTKPYSAKSCM